jgi:catechol 2,3-dioxygenase-like lactoylglutathione lyase family enzyme
MTHPNFLLHYVASPVDSARFYARLLGMEPIEASPTFAMFALPSGMKLGLWARHTVEPSATAAAGAHELAFAVPDMDAVHRLHAEWTAAGLPIIQAPTEMDFGFTFVAHDPDGHRLRVFAPS